MSAGGLERCTLIHIFAVGAQPEQQRGHSSGWPLIVKHRKIQRCFRSFPTLGAARPDFHSQQLSRSWKAREREWFYNKLQREFSLGNCDNFRGAINVGMHRCYYKVSLQKGNKDEIEFWSAALTFTVFQAINHVCDGASRRWNVSAWQWWRWAARQGVRWLPHRADRPRSAVRQVVKWDGMVFWRQEPEAVSGGAAIFDCPWPRQNRIWPEWCVCVCVCVCCMWRMRSPSMTTCTSSECL